MLLKETSSLLSEGLSNIYLKVTVKKMDLLKTSIF